MPFFAHLGVGLIGKTINPKINVWITLIAAMLLDILSIFLTSAIWITHGLMMTLIWSVLAMGITAIVTLVYNQKKPSSKIPLFSTVITIGLLVLSHWVLDFMGWPMTVAEGYFQVPLIGPPLLFNDSLNYGIGIYRSLLGALVMEVGIFLLGLFLYVRMKTKSRKVKLSNRKVDSVGENNSE